MNECSKKIYELSSLGGYYPTSKGKGLVNEKDNCTYGIKPKHNGCNAWL